MISRSALGRTPLAVHQTRAFVKQGLQRRIAVRQISRLCLRARVPESAQLHDAVHLTLAALLRRRNQVSDMSSAAKQGDVELFVLSGRGAPELDELTNLPTGVHLLGTGRPDQELKGEQSAPRMSHMHVRHVSYQRMCMLPSRLVEGRLGEGAGAAEVWNRQRCIDEARAAGA